MCGIFGMAFQKGHNMTNAEEIKYVLDSLLIESQARGSHASGVAFVSQEKVVVTKSNIPATKLIETDSYKESARRCLYLVDDVGPDRVHRRPTIILGHTRFKTKGTPENHHNNHPIVTNKVIGVHNGVITNDDALFERFTKKFSDTFVRRARVDSEIIFRLIDHYSNVIDHNMTKSIKATSRMLEGGYACATVNVRAPHMLWLFRCTMPIEIIHYPTRGLIIFASSSRFIRSAVDGVIKEGGMRINLEACSGVGINLFQNRQITFDIPAGDANIKDYYNNQMWKA